MTVALRELAFRGWHTVSPLQTFAIQGIVVAIVGCSAPIHRQFDPSGRPGVIDGSNRIIANRGTRVLVLSPVSLQQVAPDMTFETSAAPSVGGATADGVLQTEDYNLAVSAAERALLDGGWAPVTQAVLARAGQDRELQGGIATLRRDGHLSALQVALLLARRADADLVLLIRLVRLEPDDRLFTCTGGAHIQTFAGTTDVVLIAAASGEVIWSGRARVESLDALRDPAIFDGTSYGGGSPQDCNDGRLQQSPEVLCFASRSEACTPREATRLVELAVELVANRVTELARSASESEATATAGGEEMCPPGQVRTEDTRGNCCWPAQAWSSTRRECVGRPECPSGFAAAAHGCVAACEPGQTITDDTRGHCCWPAQAWSNVRQACVGEPQCPSGLRADGDRCVQLR